ncbi:Fe-S-containing protein [Cardiobacterium sp. Marseille-Q4385]|uniref:Fe-S-containing protein n=1 Tax=Cardiobacterium sp. Marseille-Q4385 TaxID=2866573 RepID=UPI002714D2F0|nr:Fe-S-containing protein [Cardiobacterium sp. Marseille-Q4385]
MSLFFSLFVRCFWLPLFWATALSAAQPPRPQRMFIAFVCGLLAAGVTVAALPLQNAAAMFWFAPLQLALLTIVWLWALIKPAAARDGLWFTAGFLGAVPFFSAPVMSAFSSTSVVNSTFILHLAAVLAAAGLSVLLVLWLFVLRSLVAPKVWLGLAVLMVAVMVLLWTVWLGADFGLAAIKLQKAEVTAFRLRWLARAEFARNWFAYVALLLPALATVAALFSAWLPARRRLQAADSRADVPLVQPDSVPQAREGIASVPADEKAIATGGAYDRSAAVHRRLLLAGVRRAQRAYVQGFAACALALGVCLFWDLVASRPPSLSKATPVVVAADDMVHLPIVADELKDGDLHRYAWVSSEGKVVRFFVIDRFPGEWSPAVVFDACMLCGDTGYAMQGDQVMCIGCGVRLFRPSVGKSGGCNPVPIEDWAMDADEIRIPRKSLEAGLQFFKAVVELEVIDPVDGSRLKNTTAPHRYSYGTKTYFFANEANYQRFVDNPELFIKD